MPGNLAAVFKECVVLHTDMFAKSLGFGRDTPPESGALLADWPNSGSFREPFHSDKVWQGLVREPRGETNHVERE